MPSLENWEWGLKIFYNIHSQLEHCECVCLSRVSSENINTSQERLESFCHASGKYVDVVAIMHVHEVRSILAWLEMYACMTDVYCLEINGIWYTGTDHG